MNCHNLIRIEFDNNIDLVFKARSPTEISRPGDETELTLVKQLETGLGS